MFGETDRSWEGLVHSRDQKSFKITYVKINWAGLFCSFHCLDWHWRRSEKWRYCRGGMRRVGIIPSMFLHFRQLLLSVNSYLEFITFFTTWLHRIREWMTPWSLDQKSNNGSLDITAPWDFNGSRKDLRLLSRKFAYTPWHAVWLKRRQKHKRLLCHEF